MSACSGETMTVSSPASASISKTSVFPEPVGARCSTSRPSSIAAMASAWLRRTRLAEPSRVSRRMRHSSARRGSVASSAGLGASGGSASKLCAPAHRKAATSGSVASGASIRASWLGAGAVGSVAASPNCSFRGCERGSPPLAPALGADATRGGERKTAAAAAAAARLPAARRNRHGLCCSPASERLAAGWDGDSTAGSPCLRVDAMRTCAWRRNAHCRCTATRMSVPKPKASPCLGPQGQALGSVATVHAGPYRRD